MRGAWGRGLTAVAAAIVVLVALAGVAAAETPAAAKPATFTADDLEGRLWKNPASAVAMVLSKFAVAAGGLTILVLEASKRRAIARGLIRRPRLPPPPPPLIRIASPGAAGGAAGKDGVALILVLVLIVVAAALAPLALAALEKVAPDWPDLAHRMVATAVPMLLLAVFVLARRARTLRDPGPPAAPTGVALAEAGRAFCVATAFLIPAGIVWGLVVRSLKLPDQPQDLIGVVVAGSAFDAFLVASFGVLVAPFTEECLFRALLYPQVRALMHRCLACTATGVAFAAIHENWVAFLPLVVLAWFLCDLYERTRSILAVVSVHAAFNASTLIPLLLLRGA